MNSIKPVFPVMGYNHSALTSDMGSASITGGFFYRSKTDPCLYGRYVHYINAISNLEYYKAEKGLFKDLFHIGAAGTCSQICMQVIYG